MNKLYILLKYKTGKGTYFDKETGIKYTGDYLNNQKFGIGKLVWPNGEQYEGEFKNDKFNGNGVHIF